MQIVHVPRHLGANVTVHDGRFGALVLLHFWDNFAGNRDGYIGEKFLCNIAGAALMLAIDISVDKTNSQRLNVVRHPGFQRLPKSSLIERGHNRSIGRNSFRGTDSELEWRKQGLLYEGNPTTESTGTK